MRSKGSVCGSVSCSALTAWAAETGEQDEIIIARNGRPAARLVPLERKGGVRIGIAKGKFAAPEESEELDRIIAEMFYDKDEPAGE